MTVVPLSQWHAPIERKDKEERAPRRRVQRRFEDQHELEPERVYALPGDNIAMRKMRPMFPTRVVRADEAPRVLVDGKNSRKIGDRVVKGPWAGMPIYTLTLPERATCPATCHHLADCYGNGMQWARRIAPGQELEEALDLELTWKQRAHPDGFVVRLHVLGDFYATRYVARWAEWLERFPALRVWGYTAWPDNTPIGSAVRDLADRMWPRFAIRYSSREPGPQRAITVDAMEEAGEAIICPVQTGATETCGTCGLCWSDAARGKTIAFVRHGMKKRVKG